MTEGLGKWVSTKQNWKLDWYMYGSSTQEDIWHKKEA
jgi:hypothetical protein